MIQVDPGHNRSGQDSLALPEGELLQHLLCLGWQHSDDHTTCLVYDLNPTPNQPSEQQSQKQQWRAVESSGEHSEQWRAVESSGAQWSAVEQGAGGV